MEQKTGSGDIFSMSTVKFEEDAHGATRAIVPNINNLYLLLFRVTSFSADYSLSHESPSEVYKGRKRKPSS